jgi:iron complex outermembrane receptor protein
MRNNKSSAFPRFSKSVLGAVVALMAATPVLAQTTTTSSEEGQPRAKDDTVRLGTITIIGDGSKLGTGQMLNEDAVKGRSTVTKAATEKNLATGNPFQALALLPGINTFNHDATGLFGGGLNIRGFGADQVGFTINGVPVNDSGNFAVYPQEYADQENLCTQTVSQGNPDVESPHSGATGGNVGITSCDPENARRFRFAQTLGNLNLSRTFVRLDTGRFADDKVKVFASLSHTQADKWKGEGGAKKDHFDAAFRWDMNADNTVLGSLLYNKAINNNILSISASQLNTLGYYYDYSTTFTPGHLPAGTGAQKETGPNPAYYKLAVNPFENAIASFSGSFKLATETYLKVQPYYWYGFGNGGLSHQAALSETAFLDAATGKPGAGVDLNGDKDTLDTVIVARASVTRTQRPGITAEINKTINNHQLRFGVWYERAEHRQTQPAVPVSADGESTDFWLQNGQVLRPNGSTYQGRDWKTISTSYQFYVSDTISFMGDRGVLSLGLRAPNVTRDVTNFANEGFTTTYNIQKTYRDVLPQLGARFNLDKGQQVFMNIGKNFRAAPNFAFTGSNVKLNTTTGKVELVTEALPETSIMTDLGYRLQTRAFSMSATLFNSNFKDRQSNAYDPVADRSTYTNAGRVKTTGLELEAGTAPFLGGFTAYASMTAQSSEMQDDITVAKGQLLPTAGKQFTLVPDRMIGASLQYANGPFYARVKLKHTGRQYAALMNDEEVPSYTVGDLDAGYNFGKFGALSNLQLRFNVSNIANAQYRSPTSGSVVNATKFGTTNPSTVFYYLGAPRFAAVSLSADFK